MAWALVQSPAEVVANNVTSTTLAYASNVTAGNFLIAYQSQWHATAAGTIQTPTDTLTHTYVQNGAQQTTAAAEQAMRTYHKAGCSGGANTVTFANSTDASDITGVIGEFSGGATSTPLDVSAVGAATGTAATTAGTAGTAVDSSLAISAITYDGLTASITPSGTVATTLQENEANSTSAAIGVHYDLDTGAATTVVTATATLGASRAYIMRVDVFKPAVAAGGATGRIAGGSLAGGVLTSGKLAY